MRSIAAGSLDLGSLRALFNAGFSDYLVPLQLGEDAFREHLEHNDIDLGCSQVLVEDAPAAFALIGRRGGDCWVGGMGTVPAHRRQGIGERALVRSLQTAAEEGCTTAWLEVLEDNRPAIGLYEKLGFEAVRELIVWWLSPPGRSGPGVGAPGSRVLDERSASAWIAAHRVSREPWQRADESLHRMREGGKRLHAAGILAGRGGGEELSAAIIYRRVEDTVHLLQLAAFDEASAADALLAALDGAGELRLPNVPGDEPASRALATLGGQPRVRQREMRLAL